MEKENSFIQILQIIMNFLSIPLMIFNIVVFVQCLNGNTSLLTLSGILNAIDFILSGGKTFIILIPLSIATIIKTGNFWTGVCYALLVENTFASIFGIITMVLGAIGLIKQKN